MWCRVVSTDESASLDERVAQTASGHAAIEGHDRETSGKNCVTGKSNPNPDRSAQAAGRADSESERSASDDPARAASGGESIKLLSRTAVREVSASWIQIQPPREPARRLFCLYCSRFAVRSADPKACMARLG